MEILWNKEDVWYGQLKKGTGNEFEEYGTKI